MANFQLILITVMSHIFSLYTTITASSEKVTYSDINDDHLVNRNNENTSPILGILAQEVPDLISEMYPDNNYTSYIAASYVKFVEGAGARVVPIMIGQTRGYYKNLLSKLNGVLFPGGAAKFNASHGYSEAGRHIYELAKEINDNGINFPLWGICLGFQFLLYCSNNFSLSATECSSSDQALPLEFTKCYENSRLFAKASLEVIEILKNDPVTANFHLYCIAPKLFEKTKLHEFWNILSLNHDWEGMEFVSTIEHKKYPFYGVQFHPEKNIYEFIPNHNITHTSRAIQTSKYFAEFLVNEARRNHQHFDNEEEEWKNLIFNYSPVYTRWSPSFLQQYFFELK